MTVGADKLIRMAEQIAANISVSRDTDVVAEQLAGHLKRYWDPRMLSEFVSQAEGSDHELSPVLAAAIDKLKVAV